MCTVSFVVSQENIILTSNRDEKKARPKAITPKTYMGTHKKMFFPKDSKAGGTWYILDDSGNVIILLNGASEKHIPKEHYRKSRGLILLEIFDSANCLEIWNSIDLTDIEPFTLIAYWNNQLYQWRWNGTSKETTTLDKLGKYIWSSSTLYPSTVRKEREKLFQDFINLKSEITAEDMMQFHQHTNPDDLENGLIINRNNTLITLSITQTVLDHNKIYFTHKDLVENKTFENNFLIL